jgi:hypothetical protein
MQPPQDLLFHAPLPQDLAAENWYLALWSRATPIRESLTARWLDERGLLERAGGMSAIAEKESGDSVNVSGCVETQARVIRDRAVLRKIRVALAAYETRIDANGSTRPSEMLGSLEALMKRARVTGDRGWSTQRRGSHHCGKLQPNGLAFGCYIEDHCSESHHGHGRVVRRSPAGRNGRHCGAAWTWQKRAGESVH